mmetsp:Transcript_29338/g.44204  ORF Transcript_29338/g.44204 Transcript_29338/m.44204 type:complete len:208 (+) Transcript_29338:845-1468(+)
MKNRKFSDSLQKKYQAYNKDMKGIVTGELVYDLDNFSEESRGPFLANKPHRQTEKRTIMSNSVFSKKPKEVPKPKTHSSASKQSSYGDKFSNWMKNIYRQTKTSFISKRSVNLKKEGFFRVNKSPISECSMILNKSFENPSVVANPDISHAYLNDHENENRVFQLNRQMARAFQSVTWFTYRDHIEQNLGRTSLTSDAGWGCMVRTG